MGRATGSVSLSGETVFGHVIGGLSAVLGPLALPLVLVTWLGGVVALVRRDVWLPAILSVLGAPLPPFGFIANWRPHPFADRYVYLVMSASLAILVWAAVTIGKRPAKLSTVSRSAAIASFGHRGAW